MCDTLVVVSPGRVAFAKNSDRDPNEAQRLEWCQAKQHGPDEQLRCTWLTIPQVRQTQAVLLSRPFWTWGAEMGANASGLVIGNEAVFTTAGFDEPGLTGMDLVRLALERAASASQAVEVIQELVQRYGQGGRAGYSNPSFRYHNSFLIADCDGAAVLETAGREVAVEWIRSGARAISNGLTLPALRGRADRLRSRVAQCGVRRQRMELLGSQGTEPASLARALRDHGDRSVDAPPRFRRTNGALSAPCVHWGGMLAGSQTVGSWISILQPGQFTHWATGTSAPCLSLFRPISVARPRPLPIPTGKPDSQSLWWRFERLHRRIMHHWPAAQPMRAERDALEQRILATPEAEDEHWAAADAWLARWQNHFDGLADRRPRWLKKLWDTVEAEAAEGSRLPPRDS